MMTTWNNEGMTTWAVIPAKSERAAKSRLAGVLDAEQRAELARRLLRGTVTAALACPALAGVVVVSASPELRDIARRLGAYAFPEPTRVDERMLHMRRISAALRGAGWKPAVPGTARADDIWVMPDPAADAHNRAVRHGCSAVVALGAAGALVLPADLPLLSAEIVAEFLDEAGDAPLALAADRRGTGTNALLLRPPLALAPAFGPGSFQRHRALAREHGLAVVTVRLPELAFDLDTPEDLAALGLAGFCVAECVHE